jgi:hypothetical protein
MDMDKQQAYVWLVVGTRRQALNRKRQERRAGSQARSFWLNCETTTAFSSSRGRPRNNR